MHLSLQVVPREGRVNKDVDWKGFPETGAISNPGRASAWPGFLLVCGYTARVSCEEVSDFGFMTLSWNCFLGRIGPMDFSYGDSPSLYSRDCLLQGFSRA
jgi:hypothetical protein